MTRNNVVVILPARNEEQGIGATISNIRSLSMKADILVVDNASQDHTAEIAKGFGIVPLPVTVPGKGNAIRKALSVIKAKYVFMLDSDHTYPAVYLPAMLTLLQNDFEVVVGTRTLIEPGAMSQLHRIGNKVLSLYASLLYLKGIHDLCSGMWGFRNYVAQSLNIKSRGFTLEAEIFSKVAGKYTLGEIPIRYDARKGETHLKWLHGFEIALYLTRRRFNV